MFLLFPGIDGLPLLPPPALAVKVLDTSSKAARVKMTLSVGQIDIGWYRMIS